MSPKKSAKKTAKSTAARATAKPASASKPSVSKPAVAKPAVAKPAVTKPAAAKASKAKGPAERLSLAEVMSTLEQLGTEQTCKTWKRHGATGPMFGVLFGELFKLMKRIDVDHELARGLWATGNVDAQNLAMKIADPEAMTSDELDQWAIGYWLRLFWT